MSEPSATKAENERYPKNADGHVMSPRYVPAGSSYLSEWRLWCKEHKRETWPEWLKHDIGMMRRKT